MRLFLLLLFPALLLGCDPPGGSGGGSAPNPPAPPPEEADSPPSPPPPTLLERLVKASPVAVARGIARSSLTFADDGSFKVSHKEYTTGLPDNKPISEQSIEDIAKVQGEEYSNLRVLNSNTPDFVVEHNSLNYYRLTDERLEVSLVKAFAIVDISYIQVYKLLIEGNNISLTKMRYYGRQPGGSVSTYAAAQSFAAEIAGKSDNVDFVMQYSGSF